MGITENVGTFNLSAETITIVEAWSVRNLSIVLVSGTVTITGLMKLGARNSDSYTLLAGLPLNLSFDFSMDGVTINASAGAATLITGK
jgi:hypothetical protein